MLQTLAVKLASPDLRSVAKCLLVLLLLWGGALLAQTNGGPAILFLHLKVKNQVVSLVETSTSPGVLKKSRDPVAGELQYELVSTTGESLWKGAVADPSIRHLEYEDPPGSGKLKSKTILLDEAEFTIRVPVVSKARQVNFCILDNPAAGAEGGKGLTNKSLGSVVLP
jgi:hypothetical protein